MDKSLRDAAQKGSVDALYALIQRDAKVLDRIDDIPFVDTPLHDAAYAGHTRFAMEIVRLKPSFIRKLNQNGFTPVHLALQNDQIQLLHRLLDVDEDLVRVQGREGVTPLHYVAQIGDLYLLAEFRKVCPMSIKDVTIRGETALHIALNNDQIDAFHLLVGWLQHITLADASSLWEKKLLNWKDEEGKTLFHIAIMKTLPQVVRRLLDATVDTNAKNLQGVTALDILEGQALVGNNNDEIWDMLASSDLPRNMENNAADLSDAAQQGSVDALYRLIHSDANVLDRIDDIPFVETPLHIAVSAGHTYFALEIMKLKPSFAKKLNKDGFTPVHLALQNKQTQLVLRLVDVDKELVRVKGRDNVTPLHSAAQLGKLDLLAKFLKVCPESIKDVTIRKETALHIALKYDTFDAFQLILKWLKQALFKDVSLWEKKLLYWEDEEGNTLMHVAVTKNQTKVVQWLLDSEPLKILFVDRGLLYGKRKNLGEIGRQQTSITDERRNVLLVVAVVLVTVTYQAALLSPISIQPPDQDQKPNQFNCTVPPINATGANHFNCIASQFNASQTEVIHNLLLPAQNHLFYFLNSLTYFLTNVALFLLLPPDFTGTVLSFLLFLLLLCYGVSKPILVEPHDPTAWRHPGWSYPIYYAS
ncbi:hypothetical protein FH972_012608 [Carpinus fangiana]|uniref:Uncharacterized protein n=1 Tax=Carpinus fangiana TaxID=176857 RepID=A0A5N6R4I5_9ROSI|nr:hypothetical protein FH972_012608 [Carpinus fangiana]